MPSIALSLFKAVPMRHGRRGSRLAERAGTKGPRSMPHAHTHQMLEEWRRQRGDARLPPRPHMSAESFGHRLPQVFVLGLSEGVWRFRLSGGFLTDLHGRELRGERFDNLWTAADRPEIIRILEKAVRLAQPALLHARAEASPRCWTDLEISLAPLAGPTGAADRAIGLFQPVSPVARLEGRTAARLRLTSGDLAPGTVAGSRPRLVIDNT